MFFTGKISELSAWQESVENSMAQLEHQAVRAMNLELMLEYGCEAWKAHLEIFTSLQAKAQLRLQELKKEIQEINWQRKSKQTEAGSKLRALEAQWVMLVSKNYEIEQACAKLEETCAAYRAAMPFENHTEESVQVSRGVSRNRVESSPEHTANETDNTNTEEAVQDANEEECQAQHDKDESMQSSSDVPVTLQQQTIDQTDDTDSGLEILQQLKDHEQEYQQHQLQLEKEQHNEDVEMTEDTNRFNDEDKEDD